MAWKAKNASILLVDVGVTMREPLSKECSGAVTKADMAVRLARNVLQQKLLFMPKHEVGIVLFGTSETKNELQTDGEYQNVFVARDGKVDVVDLAAMRFLAGPPPDGQASDAVNGLIVAIDMIIKRTREQKYTKTIHLLTDCRSVAPGDLDLLECVRQAESTGIRINVTLVGAKHSANWESLAETSPQVSLVPMATLARDASMCVRPVEQRAKVRLQMVISPDVQIPIGVFSKTVRVGLPNLRKRSKVAAAAAPPEEGVKDSVIMERSYHPVDDPDGEEVKKEDQLKGHKYGQSIVPMSEYDEAALMYTCDRTLTALGFARASAFGPEHSMQQVDAVAADRGDRWAHTAFESLVDAMLSKDVVLVARYSFRKNSQPRLVALFPNKGQGGSASHLVLQYLPFEEDIREWTVASLPVPTPAQRDAASALLDAMCLDGPAGVSFGEELLRPEDTHNPSLSRFYTFLTQRAVDAAAKVPPAGPEMLSMLEPPSHVRHRIETSKATELLKGAFNFEKVEKKVGRTKRFWREAIAQKRRDADLGEVDIKKIKVDGLVKKKEDDEEDRAKDEGSQELFGAPGMASPVEPAPRCHIGSVNPVRDFEQWLAHRSGGVDTMGEAMRQMRSVIERLVDEGEEFDFKALGCLTALRKGCVEESEASAYNEFARKLRFGATKRHAKFWEKARDAKLGLVTDAEVPTSTVTVDEARAFLEGREYISPTAPVIGSAPPATAGTSDKDLEDMIE